MTHSWLREPVFLGSAGAAVAVLGGVGVYLAMRKKPTADEIERGRRTYLVEVGRIIDGTVLDLTDMDTPGAPNGGWKRHIFYKYEVAGVGYECSQDVTLLPEQLAGATSTPGTPASVRYDPHNPGNSVVVAEAWTGLRHGQPTIQLPVRAATSSSAQAPASG
jgi:hypothetical protein